MTKDTIRQHLECEIKHKAEDLGFNPDRISIEIRHVRGCIGILIRAVANKRFCSTSYVPIAWMEDYLKPGRISFALLTAEDALKDLRYRILNQDPDPALIS